MDTDHNSVAQDTPETAHRPPTRRDNEKTVAGAHRAMRRADREITDPAAIREIIDSSPVMHVAYRDAEGQTLVPMDFGYEINGAHYIFYFHSAHYGRKIDAIRAAGVEGLSVAFDMVADNTRTIPGRTACSWGRAYASIVGTGTARIVSDPQDAKKGMSLLMAHEAGMVDEAGNPTMTFTDQQVRAVIVWRIDVDVLSAKSRPMPPAKTPSDKQQAD